jgi:trimeric autotransporter adhesin
MIERRVAGKLVLPRSKKRRLIVSITRTKAADLGSAATDAAQNVAQNVAQNATVVAQNATDAAQSVAHSAAQNAAAVAQNAGNAAQTTASGVKAGVRRGFFNARRWAAPRLEDAADYTTTTAAPAVSSALLATARKVRPAQESQRKRSALKWSLLASACLAAAGAVAAAVRYKYRSAMAADTEVEDTTAADTAAEPIAPTADKPAEPATDDVETPAEPATDDVEASVNGRVSKDGW